MKQLKRLLLLLCIFVLQVGLYSPTCNAENDPSLIIEQNVDTVKISGKVTGSKPYATILIVYPDKEVAPKEYQKNEVADQVINEIGILEVKNGNYSFTYTMKADVPSGVYSVYVKYDNTVFNDQFTHISYNDRSNIIAQLNSSDGNIIPVLKMYQNILPLNLETKYEVVSNELKGYLEQKLAQLIPITSINDFIAECKKTIEKVYALDIINKSGSNEVLAQNLEVWAGILDIQYNKNEEAINDFYSVMRSKLPFHSKETFNQEFKKNYFLHQLNMASWGKYYDILKNNVIVTGIDINSELKGLTGGRKESL